MAWQKTSSSFPCMGTLIRLTIFSKEDPHAPLLAARRRYEALDQLLSHYRPDSEVCQLKPGSPQRVSPELFTILTFAQRLALHTHGAFDVTLGHHTQLLLGRQTVTLLHPEMKLDLGGIAKGFANDQAARVLHQHGISRFLLAASGDVLTGDAPPDEPGWRVALPARVVTLKRRAVSTSGNTFQPGHIQDSRSREKVLTPAPLSVLAPTSMAADALATACFILPPAERPALLRHYRAAETISA